MRCIFSITLLVSAAAATAQAESLSQFSAVADLNQSPDGPALILGRAANPGDYPASFYAKAGESWCSSTLVGPRALLTAAHCVENQGNVRLAVGKRTYSGTCSHAPAYARDATADWAMCVMEEAVPAARYETIEVDPQSIKLGEWIRLTGFGCTNDDMSGGNDGIYRYGDARVVSLPSTTSHDIVTRDPKGNGAVLCPGDSGGPAFFSRSPDYRQRRLVAVNSRTAVDQRTGKVLDTSFVSSISVPEAQAFLKEWMLRHGVAVCGLQADMPHCR